MSKAVRDLRKAIRVQQVALSAELSETSTVGPHEFEGPFGKVSYSYQRSDLSRTGIDWVPELYARSSTGRASDGLFFSSGMSAVGAVSSVLSRLGARSISISPMAYYETHLLNTRFFPELEIETTQAELSSEADVLWLDTSSTEWSEVPAHSGSVKVMVVDTTCVEADAGDIDGWMDDSRRLGCPLLLLRSHLKLDTFGLELGKLGSIVAISPDQESRHIDDLLSSLRQARAGLGLGFELAHLYPWLGEPEFFELSRLRADGISRSTEIVTSTIEAARAETDAFEIIPTAHRSLLFIKTGMTFPDEAWVRARGLPDTIASRGTEAGLPVWRANSFGSDRFTVLDFVDIHDGAHYLRISGAAVPDSQAAALGQHIRDATAEMLSQPWRPA
ncbi:MAG: hypothetical protein ACC726_02140 [Chloroflexota bacterium]